MIKEKYRIILLVLLILTIFSINMVEAHKNMNNLPLLHKVITIDPGHGGIG